MKRILSLVLAWALVFATPLGFAQVSVDASKTGSGFASTATWVGKPAATTAPAGALLFASDLGENGSYWQSNGTRWRALNGAASLKHLAAASASLGSGETIVLQTLLPIGSWQAGDILRVRFTMSKSGATDIGRFTLRIGTAGTTADTAITGLSAHPAMAVAHLSGGWEYDVRLVSATSALKIGNAGQGMSGYAGGVASAAVAATTITDASANALYVSMSFYSAGATDTVTVPTASISLVTP